MIRPHLTSMRTADERGKYSGRSDLGTSKHENGRKTRATNLAARRRAGRTLFAVRADLRSSPARRSGVLVEKVERHECRSFRAHEPRVVDLSPMSSPSSLSEADAKSVQLASLGKSSDVASLGRANKGVIATSAGLGGVASARGRFFPSRSPRGGRGERGGEAARARRGQISRGGSRPALTILSRRVQDGR